jgi:hypothetical protein
LEKKTSTHFALIVDAAGGSLGCNSRLLTDSAKNFVARKNKSDTLAIVVTALRALSGTSIRGN